MHFPTGEQIQFLQREGVVSTLHPPPGSWLRNPSIPSRHPHAKTATVLLPHRQVTPGSEPHYYPSHNSSNQTVSPDETELLGSSGGRQLIYDTAQVTQALGNAHRRRNHGCAKLHVLL